MIAFLSFRYTPNANSSFSLKSTTISELISISINYLVPSLRLLIRNFFVSASHNNLIISPDSNFKFGRGMIAGRLWKTTKISVFVHTLIFREAICTKTMVSGVLLKCRINLKSLIEIN